jgi:hypothetical protein
VTSSASEDSIEDSRQRIEVRRRTLQYQDGESNLMKQAVAGARVQRGMGLFGLLFLLVLIGAVVLVGLKVFPTVNEYLTIKRAVNKIAASSPNNVDDVRRAFEATKAVEYSIVSIGGKDLIVTKNGDDLNIAFAYNVEIELIPPVFLLMKYRGQAK